MSACQHDTCTQAAVFNTGRCLEHAEPATSRHATYSTGYHDDVPNSHVALDETPQVMPPARPYLKPALEVGFDEPPVRGWLARAIGRIFR